MRVRVILLEPEVSGNIGAVARSMKNFGLDDLWIVNPKTTLQDDARAFAMHGLSILESAKVATSLDSAIVGVNVLVGTSSVTARSTSNLPRIAVTPKQLVQKMTKSGGTLGIMFGRESSGLTNHEVESCDFMVTIPANREYNVLNVSAAASIIFYELFQTKPTSRAEVATQSSRRRLLLQFDELVTLSGIQVHKGRLARRAFRNVISRSLISSREASLLIGLFRKSSARLGKLK